MHRRAHEHARTQHEPLVRTPLPLHQHPLLDLETDFMFVSVVPVEPGEEPCCELTTRGPRSTPEISVTASEGVTRVRFDGLARAFEDSFAKGRFWDGPFWAKRHHRHAQITLRVPSNVRARVRSAAAVVRVSHLSGCELTVHADAGAMQLEDVAGRLTLSTNAGRIDGHGLAGTIDVSTNAGAVQLELRDLDAGAHSVRTNVGAARVALAKGMPVEITTRTAMGSARVDFPSVKGAQAALVVEAELGGIRVGASESTWTPGSEPFVGPTPYRSPGAVDDGSAGGVDKGLTRVLEQVAEGAVSPADARELLRAMGWG